MDFITLWNEISNTAKDDYYSLSEAEQTLFNIKSIADNSCEGGLKSYYLSFAGAYASDAAEQLYSLGLDLIAAVIENCNSLFPDGIPPENDAERTEIIDADTHSDAISKKTDNARPFYFFRQFCSSFQSNRFSGSSAYYIKTTVFPAVQLIMSKLLFFRQFSIILKLLFFRQFSIILKLLFFLRLSVYLFFCYASFPQ